MNRQQRRQLSRRGQEPDTDGSVDPGLEPGVSVPEDLDEGADDGGDGRVRAGERVAHEALAPTQHRLGPRQFLHEVNSELRKVAWPSSAETINYSMVVLVTLVLLTALIFGLDYLFTKFAGFLFNP